MAAVESNNNKKSKKKNLLTITFQTAKELEIRRTLRDTAEKVYESKGAIKFIILDGILCRKAQLDKMTPKELEQEKARFDDFSREKWGGPTKSPKGRKAKKK